MIIQWLGQSCFKITTKNNQGEFTILTNPFKDSAGLKMPKTQADIVTLSSEKKEIINLDALKNDPYLIKNPGEYETNGVFVYGINSLVANEKSSIYKIFSEDISLLHLGSLTEALNNEQLDRVGNIDILFILVDEKKSESKKISELISQIEPRLVIPMTADTNIDEKFLNDLAKSCGLKSETIDKLKILKKDLATEETKMVILQK
jgi:L-ascorbate metabolism protein UlaG (beta-lactamase superfamily)